MNDAPVSAEAAANEFIRLGANDGNPMSNLLLHKLLYIAHGFYLAMEGEPLIADKFEVRKHGPVIPDLYSQIRKTENDRMIWEPLSGDAVLDEKRKAIIEDTYKNLGKSDPWGLVRATHRKDSAWSRAKDADEFVIDNRLIKAEFSNFLVE